MGVKMRLSFHRSHVEGRGIGVTFCSYNDGREKLWGERASIPHIWRFCLGSRNRKCESFPQKMKVFHSCEGGYPQVELLVMSFQVSIAPIGYISYNPCRF
jgi:hypothetical protein